MNFEYLNQMIKYIEDNLTEIPVLLQSGKEKEASDVVKNFAECFDNFCKAVTLFCCQS